MAWRRRIREAVRICRVAAIRSGEEAAEEAAEAGARGAVSPDKGEEEAATYGFRAPPGVREFVCVLVCVCVFALRLTSRHVVWLCACACVVNCMRLTVTMHA